MSTSSIGSTIFSGLWSVILSLFRSISAGLGGMFQQMMSGFGQSVVLMFQSFGFSMSGYGVWAPVMFVVGLGTAVLVGYLFFTFIDAEKAHHCYAHCSHKNCRHPYPEAGE